MKTQKDIQSTRPITALERLVGTESFRKDLERDLDEKADAITQVLRSASTLLGYWGDEVNNGREVSYNVPFTISEMFGGLPDRIEDLRKVAKRLAAPADPAVPGARVSIPGNRRERPNHAGR